MSEARRSFYELEGQIKASRPRVLHPELTEEIGLNLVPTRRRVDAGQNTRGTPTVNHDSGVGG
jgi:hypothetical protein